MVGELNRCTCHLALSLLFRLIVFSPLFCGRTYKFQCLGMGHEYLKLFITLGSHWSSTPFYFSFTPVSVIACWHVVCCSFSDSGGCLHHLITQHNFLAIAWLSRTSFLSPMLAACCLRTTRCKCMSPEREREWYRLIWSFPLVKACSALC